MYTKELRPKFFSTIPIYDLINNISISLSAKEWKRVEEIQLMSTKVLVGKNLELMRQKKNIFLLIILIMISLIFQKIFVIN